MEKFLLFLGFQLTQTALLATLDGSAWRLLSARDLAGAVRQLDLDAAALLFQALLSGTWVGRIAEIGDVALAVAAGVQGMPLALMVAQWSALLLWLVFERMVFERRMRRFAAPLAPAALPGKIA